MLIILDAFVPLCEFLGTYPKVTNGLEHFLE